MKQFCLRGHDTFICGRDKNRLCRECSRFLVSRWGKAHKTQRNLSRKRSGNRRRKFIDEMKACPCSDCGIKYPPYVMQFDHIKSEEKVRDIASWQTYSLGALLIEVTKCEIVCANCHAIRTHNRNQNKYNQNQKGEILCH